MKALRDAWANASDTVRIVIIVAAVAALWAGLGLGWLPIPLGG